MIVLYVRRYHVRMTRGNSNPTPLHCQSWQELTSNRTFIWNTITFYYKLALLVRADFYHSCSILLWLLSTSFLNTLILSQVNNMQAQIKSTLLILQFDGYMDTPPSTHLSSSSSSSSSTYTHTKSVHVWAETMRTVDKPSCWNKNHPIGHIII